MPDSAGESQKHHLSKFRPHGLDLFNHGYYWEAHEAWESL
jgi:Domain of unknown function (DUF309)